MTIEARKDFKNEFLEEEEDEEEELLRNKAWYDFLTDPRLYFPF